MRLRTHESERLYDYARHLEQEVAILKADLAKARSERDRAIALRIRDREIAAHYRAIVEGDVA